MFEQVILDVDAMRYTDQEDASGWTYAVFYCPHRDTSTELGCIGAYGDPFDLLGHMQYCHTDVDHGEGTPSDVDHGYWVPVDVDHGEGTL